tara:strand:+ start:167 stop:721 length:555 start_codon:yes stop_codon:yes gene_type:complete
MFIATKGTKVIVIHDIELNCRREAKGLSIPEYWTWLESVTTEDENGIKTYDFSGEDYEIVETDAPLSYEITNEEGSTRTISFKESGHITSNIEGNHYHLKWDGTKIIKDDAAKAAWELAEEWKQIRKQRTRLLAETDWVVIKARENGGTVPAAWKTYRVALRDIPAEQSDKTKYSDITWPTQPS